MTIRGQGRCLSLWLLGIPLFLGSTAVAKATESDLSVPIRVEINGTRDCPSADTFQSAVQDRTDSVRRARAGELGWATSITVRAVGDRRLARMTLRATEGEWIERELVAPNCGDALEAMAVVLAVLVDSAVEQSKASTRGIDADSPAEIPKPLALPRVAGGVYIPWIDDPDFFEKRGISLNNSRFIATVVGGLELDSQLARKAAFGMSLGFDVERWNPNLLRPTFGLSLGWSTAEVGNAQMHAVLQHWSLRAHLCPFELLQGRVVSLRPCARVDAGYIYAESTSSPEWAAEHRRFGMLRATPFLRATFQVAAGAQLRFDGGVSLAVLRPELVFAGSQPRQLVHSPAPAGVYGATTVAVEF